MGAFMGLLTTALNPPSMMDPTGQLEKQSVRQVLKSSFKTMWDSSRSMGKSFAVMGGLLGCGCTALIHFPLVTGTFAVFECNIEKVT